MRITLPLSAIGAVAVAVAAAATLTSCQCFTDQDDAAAPSYSFSTSGTALAITSDGSAALAFAVWSQSLHGCDSAVFAPAMHVLADGRGDTATFNGRISRAVRAGDRFVAIGVLGSRNAVLVSPIDDPGRPQATFLFGRASSLVVAADRAFFLVDGQVSIRAMGDVDLEIPTGPNPAALTVIGDYLYSASRTGGVTEIDARTLVETRRLDSCPTYSVSAFGPTALLLACEPMGLGVLDLQTGTLAVTSTDEHFEALQGTPERGAALVQAYDSVRVFVAGSGLIGEGEPLYGYPSFEEVRGLRDAVFIGTNAVAPINGSLLRFSLASGEVRPFGLGVGIDVLSRTGDTGIGIGIGSVYPTVGLVFVRFDLVTGEADEIIPLTPPPAYYRWH